jgi:hypothetical protein
MTVDGRMPIQTSIKRRRHFPWWLEILIALEPTKLAVRIFSIDTVEYQLYETSGDLGIHITAVWLHHSIVN